MGEIVKSERDLGASYTGLNIKRNSGAFNSCGYGVRDRDDETALDTTHFCTVYQPVGGGASIRFCKFRVSTGTTTAGPIILSLWYRDTGDDTLKPLGYVEFDKPAAHWLSDTEYYYEMESPISLPLSSGRTYYAAIWSEFAKLDATNMKTKRGVTFSGNALMFSPIPVADQADSDYAVSFEAWGEPSSWTKVLQGGGIEEASEEWEKETPPGTYPYCTGTMTDPEKVIGGVAGNAVSGAQNNYIALDLGGGMTATALLASEVFPDYATSGIRAVSNVSVTMTLASGGIIAVMSSESDTPIMPDISGGGWTLLGQEKYNAGSPTVTLSAKIPSLSRWIVLIELGTSTTDEISLVEISQIKTAVSDGNFPVSFLNLFHKCWTKNYPIDDAVYKVQAYSAAGAVSPLGNPFTNRKYKD